MKQIYSLPLLLFFIVSCSEQNNTNLPKNSFNNHGDTQKINPAKLVVTNTNEGDPTFVDAKDTVSVYGPSNITRNILQDRNGNIWFATWQGVIRYDGKFFTNFTLKENLKRFHVFSLLEDRAGNLWFGTIGGGVYKYDGKYFTYFTTKDGLASNVVMSMLEDKTGNIWFGTDAGVSCYYGKSFINYTTKDGLMHNMVHAMVQDKSGRIWFGTQGGISYYQNKPVPTFIRKPNLPGNVRVIIKDNSDSYRKGNIWIGSQGALSRYDPEKIGTDEEKLIRIKTNFTGCICEDRNAKLWLTGGGAGLTGMYLCHYDPEKKEESAFTEVLVKSGKNTFNNQVFGITEDKNGNIWIASATGVCCYNPEKKAAGFTFFAGPRP